MAFPPQFLEELRTRLNLSEVVSKRLRLIRAGREYKAPCPFHNEKSPSFYVNDQKGFFHCFGCGAHGDIIGFVMRHDNLGFPEAVEHLAGEAGLPVPRPTEEDRQRYERRKTLHDLVEQAARWFEQQLHTSAGRPGLDYFMRRGLDGETIARFRLGYAPGDSNALRTYLGKQGFSDEDMVNAGLLKRPDDGRAPYSFFRNRVMFPVTDRRGQVVAFGGRILEGDGPKYVNTADTPLFHKGTLLYGLSRARQAAADGKPVIVAEGYMDVIALVRAGFEGAVAPLGTALTETQVQELWKLIPAAEKVPFLCFDGDNAGRRAAWRAVERILPHLAPGQSARVAFLPEGEDPDSLIRASGAKAMGAVLEAAIPLSDALWRMESEGRPTDTPEAKAAVKAALEARVATIADRDVQSFYRTEMRRRVDEAFAPVRQGYNRGPWVPGQGRGGRFGEAPRRHVPGVPGRLTSKLMHDKPLKMQTLSQRFERIILASLINHPELIDDFFDVLVVAEFETQEFARIRECLVEFVLSGSEVTREKIIRFVEGKGFDEGLENLFSDKTYTYASFAKEGGDVGFVRECLIDACEFSKNPRIKSEMIDALRTFNSDPGNQNYSRIEALRQEFTMGTGELKNPDGESS
ncbi:DNA primase [Azospirillum sp. A1-3]|uniref:DNA primase n=1 Tax=Azospirillum sp. A1-3 TaxID=185874 RepID=UPI00207722BD|nr:DNA primase [Azospirillum sp. A1-3]MCM8733295.1 DNA primase [Azospirillum sp. A1-3]